MQLWLLSRSVPCTMWSHHLSSAPWLQVLQRELMSVWRQRARQKALSYTYWGFTFKGLSHYGYCLVQWHRCNCVVQDFSFPTMWTEILNIWLTDHSFQPSQWIFLFDCIRKHFSKYHYFIHNWNPYFIQKIMCNHSEYGQYGSAVSDILEITGIFFLW